MNAIFFRNRLDDNDRHKTYIRISKSKSELQIKLFLLRNNDWYEQSVSYFILLFINLIVLHVRKCAVHFITIKKHGYHHANTPMQYAAIFMAVKI